MTEPLRSDARDVCHKIALETGALVLCEECQDYELDSYDEEAKKLAFQGAANAWKRGRTRGTHAQVMDLMRSVIADGYSSCPQCEREHD